MLLRDRTTVFVIRDEGDADYDATAVPMPLVAAPPRVITPPPSLSTRQQRLAARRATPAAPSPRLTMVIILVALLAVAGITVMVRVVTSASVTRSALRHETVAPAPANQTAGHRRRPRNPASAPRRRHRRLSHNRPASSLTRSFGSTRRHPQRLGTPTPAPSATAPRPSVPVISTAPTAGAPTATPAPRKRQPSGFAQEFGLDG